MDIQPLESLRSSGVLWAVNRALHTRGFALALALDDDGKVTGWALVGNGNAPMAFDSDADDAGFAAFEATLANLRLGSVYVAAQAPRSEIPTPTPRLDRIVEGAVLSDAPLAHNVVQITRPRIDPPRFFAAASGGDAIAGEF